MELSNEIETAVREQLTKLEMRLENHMLPLIQLALVLATWS